MMLFFVNYSHKFYIYYTIIPYYVALRSKAHLLTFDFATCRFKILNVRVGVFMPLMVVYLVLYSNGKPN